MTYKIRPIIITPDFSIEILRVWAHVLQTIRDHRFQPTKLYPENVQSQ